LAFFAMLAVVLCLGIMDLMQTGNSGGEDKLSSPSCGTSAQCDWIKPRGQDQPPRYPFCDSSIWDMPANLTVVDFALFAKLAYYNKTMASETLESWFPGWTMHCQHKSPLSDNYTVNDESCQNVSDKEDKSDWTNFYEFWHSPSNTSVFAVRGTVSNLDFLLDVDMWAPAFILQVFSLGNTWLFPRYALDIIWQVVDWFYPGGKQSLHYKYLKDCVEHTSQHFHVFLTGHSMGGGVAKQVALELCAQNGTHCDDIRVVSFSSPNEDSSAWKSELTDRNGTYLSTTKFVNVQPHKDFVSKVDSTHGTIFPIDCRANHIPPLECHSLSETICELLSGCGNRGRNIRFRKDPNSSECKSYDTDNNGDTTTPTTTTIGYYAQK
jgi:hypothetical protein